MTIKYLDKNVSAEADEVVVTNVSLNNGVLTFSRKDFYNERGAESLTIDLKDIKLRIYKLGNNETLNDYKNTNDSAKKLKRETHLFLVSVDNPNDSHNTEGIYHEYIWDEDKNDFELLGSTYLNLDPLEGRITNAESKITALEGRMNTAESNITSLQGQINNKSTVTYSQTQSGGNNTYDIGTITIDGTPTVIKGKDTDTVYTHPTPSGLGGAKTSDLYKISTDKDGHVTGASSVGIDTTKGGTSGSNNLITSGAVYNGLADKANTSDLTGKLDINQPSHKGKNVVVDENTGEITFENKVTSVEVANEVTDGETKPVSGDAVFDYAQPKGSYLTSHQDISGKLDINQPSYKGKNVVVDETTGQIAFENKVTSVEVANAVTDGETRPVSGDAVYDALQNIPTKTSDLINDSGFITSSDVGEIELTDYIKKTSTDTGFLKSNGSVVGFGTTSGKVAEGDHTHSGFLTSSDISGKEDTSNKVTSISSSSTDTQYPSAKLVFDEIDDLWGAMPAVVDIVSSGDRKAVTSNAVYGYAQPKGNYLTSVSSGDIVDGTIVDADISSNAKIDASKIAIGQAYNSLSLTANDSQTGFNTEVAAKLNDKVDTQSGKGLSTNDFTDSYKTKLDSYSVTEATVVFTDGTTGTLKFVVEQNNNS